MVYFLIRIMKILHLTLEKKWFDLISSGKKVVEYRKDKPYWQTRLLNGEDPKHFDIVRFKNGYGNDIPTMDVEFRGIVFTNSRWCIPKNGEILSGSIIAIKLGKVLNITRKKNVRRIYKKRKKINSIVDE